MFWAGKKGFAFKDIVLKAIMKCHIELSKEMTKGGEHMTYVEGKWIPLTIPDQRKVATNCIKTLYDLLIFYFDKTAQIKLKTIQDKLDNLYAEHFKKYMSLETWNPYRHMAYHSKSIVSGKDSPVGAYILQELEEEKIDLYRQMFQELVQLFKRQDELADERMLDPLAMDEEGTEQFDPVKFQEIQKKETEEAIRREKEWQEKHDRTKRKKKEKVLPTTEELMLEVEKDG